MKRRQRRFLLVTIPVTLPCESLFSDLNAHLQETEDAISTIYSDANLKKVSWHEIVTWELICDLWFHCSFIRTKTFDKRSSQR